MAEPVAEADVPMVIPGQKPRSRRRRLIVYALLGLIVAGGFYFWFAPPALRKWRLAKSCQDADRVVLVLNVPPKRVQGGWTRGDRLACAIVGAEKVREFLAILVFQPSFPGLTCKCDGDIKLELANGENTLVTLSWHHTSHLRWRNGDWPGDTWLTDKSRAALAAWIEREGGQQLEQAEARGRTLRKEFEAMIELPQNTDTMPAEAAKAN